MNKVVSLYFKTCQQFDALYICTPASVGRRPYVVPVLSWCTGACKTWVRCFWYVGTIRKIVRIRYTRYTYEMQQSEKPPVACLFLMWWHRLYGGHILHRPSSEDDHCRAAAVAVQRPLPNESDLQEDLATPGFKSGSETTKYRLCFCLGGSK